MSTLHKFHWCAAILSLLGCGGEAHRAPASAENLAVSTVAPAGASSSSLAPSATGSTVPVAASATPADGKAFADGSNAFGFDLYRKISVKPGNVAFSPASVTFSVGMAYGGSSGETAREMGAVLHLSDPSAAVRAAGALLSSVGGPAEGGHLKIANQLFGDQSHPFGKAYLSEVERAFGAPLASVDFKNNSERERVSINGWVKSKTDDRIVDLIPTGGIDSNTRLVLVNAIHFLGSWKTQFQPKRTHDGAFAAGSGVVTVPMMGQTASYRIGETDDAQILEAPYADGKTSMLIILPKPDKTLAAVEATLSPSNVDRWVSGLASNRVDFELPKFEVAPAETLNLTEHLQSLGMKLAFTPRADFSKIAPSASAADGLFISDVFHKAYLRVDEKGTEAAAATATVMTKRGLSVDDDPVKFHVNRPFAFIVRDNASGLNWFVGRVENPRK